MSTKKTTADDKKATTVVANDPDDLKGALKKVGGSMSDHWNSLLANQAIQTLWLKHSDPEMRDRQMSATVAAMVGIGPKDELEGMMAAQLLAAHNAAMECHRRAMLGEQTFEGRRENLSQANKLSRTYAVLLDTLNRHRGKGQQTVRVEHVTVQAGGQAIVGHVETPGGGDRPKSEDQPYAKQIAHAPQPPMWSADEEREPVPVTSNAERPLPTARGNVARCPEG
jgi:hypothetical protein